MGISSTESAGILGAARASTMAITSSSPVMSGEEKTVLWGVGSPVSQGHDWYERKSWDMLYRPTHIRQVPHYGWTRMFLGLWLAIQNWRIGVQELVGWGQVVVSLWHVITLHAHGLQTSALDDENVSQLSAWDGGVSIVMGSSLFPMQARTLMTSQSPGRHVYAITRDVWSWHHCRWGHTPGIQWSPPPRASPDCAWPGCRRCKVCRTLGMGPVAFFAIMYVPVAHPPQTLVYRLQLYGAAAVEVLSIL